MARLVAALVQAAPEATRSETTEVGKKYPEFRAWHALLHPLFGLDTPDWAPKATEAQSTLMDFGMGADDDAEDDREETEED